MNTKHDEALSMERAFSVVDTLKLALDVLTPDPEEAFWFVEKKKEKTITAIREALSLVNKVDQEQPAQQQEIDELTAQRDKLADILTRTANALKGQPPELVSHSWHDLPEVAQQLKSAQQQEPVAVVSGYYGGQCVVLPTNPARIFNSGTAFYTSPPASKPWVGLTEEQMAVLNFMLGADDLDGVWFGERHPKEKGAFWWRNRLRNAFQDAAIRARGNI